MINRECVELIVQMYEEQHKTDNIYKFGRLDVLGHTKRAGILNELNDILDSTEDINYDKYNDLINHIKEYKSYRNKLFDLDNKYREIYQTLSKEDREDTSKFYSELIKR